MPENNEHHDPAASTQMFQAFVAQQEGAAASSRADSPAPAPHHRSGGMSPALIGGIVVAVIAIVVIAVVALS
ncbi:hypothetical protein ACPA54_38135 [Uniformispora flossi]|uniref:Uncharacterized protein n=1 Tax=Yinghuangia aomiensis TaxID=676205 RepID=A0ABP9IFC8_9ACTN